MIGETPAIREALAVYATEAPETEIVPPGYRRTEVGMIPEDWEVRTLGDLGSVVRGASPRPAGDPKFFNGDHIPWLTVAALTNIPDSQIEVTETFGFLTEEGARHSRLLNSGTLIVANSGATLGVAKILMLDCCANDGIAAIVDQHFGDKQFICYFVNTRTEHLRDVVATGNGQPNLNTALIREILTPYPTLVEQRAIAAALSDVDALIVALDKLIAKKRAVKTAAMQQLLTGKQRLPGFSGEWEMRSLEDVADVDSDNLTADTDPNYQFNYISLEDVDSGTLKGFSHQRFSSAPSRARRRVRAGDVLVSTVRPNLKSHLLFSASDGDWVCSTGFSLVRCWKRLASPGFVYQHLFHGVVPNQIEALIAGSNYPAISAKDVRAFQIPMPDVEEQTAIAAVLSDMDAEISALEARREKTRQVKRGMMQELLTGRTRLV